MPFYRNFSAPPTLPFRQPISSHPPTAPCGPGQRLAEGQYVSRGGVFEGAAMSQGPSHCGYWSDYVGELPLRTRGQSPGRPSTWADTRVVRAWPPETPSHFQPRHINLGYPGGMQVESAMAGLGSDSERQVTMADIANRSRPIWTGPRGDQSSWPDNMTPRGGVLDGNTLSQGQNPYAAYYAGESPRVLQPADRVQLLPNPMDAGPVAECGWGLGPAEQRRNYGADEAVRPVAIAPAGSNGANRAAVSQRLGSGACPPIAGSVFGGRVPGGLIAARSVFGTPVQADGSAVTPVSTVTPRSLSVPATSSCQSFGSCGPDGLGRW